MPDYIFTQQDQYNIKKFQRKYADGYVSPSIFRLASEPGVTAYKYYKTQSAALRQYLLVTKQITGKEPAYQALQIGKEAKPIQIGINVDFFLFSENVGVYPISYTDVKAGTAKNSSFFCLCRFYKPNDSTPYWTCYTAQALGSAASVVKNLTPEKVAALDAYQRELNIAQFNFNAFSVYINKLKSGKMNKAAWGKYEAAVNKRAKFEAALNELKQSKEVDIFLKKNNKVGVLVVDDIIIIGIVCTMVLIGYLAPKIINSLERTRTINASYNFQKFLKEQDLDIELKRKAGLLSDAQADALKNSNAQAGQAAQDVVTQTVQAAADESKKSIFDDIQKTMLIGGGLFLAYKFIK